MLLHCSRSLQTIYYNYISPPRSFDKIQSYKHSKMISHVQLILLILAIISYYGHESIAQYIPPFTSLVAPVAKHTDSANPLYSAQIMTKYVNSQFIHTNFLIDMEAPFTWYDCDGQWNIYPGSCPFTAVCLSPVSCEEYQCTDVRTSTLDRYSSCPPVTNGSTLPGWGLCSCPVTIVNPITGSCGEALLNNDELWFNGTNGRIAFPDFMGVYPTSACAPSSAFESFPKNVSGVLAMSSSPHALPMNLFGVIQRSFALCLPTSASSPGVLILGSSPYYLDSHSDVDVRSFLSYTPLLNNIQDTFGYYIGVNTIVIRKRSINVPPNATTKISTLVPYTTLRTDIYKQVVGRFSKVTKRLQPTKPVAPFGLCFKIFTNGTQAGLKVPDIDFGLGNGMKWSVSTANSMKQMRQDVWCLAFVDGGVTSEHVIVLGTFQMEDNFLLFDVVNSSLGFSSSLLNKGTSCASFNFTGV
ncbi:putative aspartic peptidase A1 family, aspartic peptidase domain superfamily, xylanase inhibitor [Helianthus annuus]|nr:putative aspartic peptidase A1 family, aspartic peptidase domain superfamily, xylanase inhibitor [Helianthus annuus]KAJ0865325.1 putative aspartic peptidase A1 family, aspartic peptidase domain superfamily, xylanase inhibitor [Helianthus annuus]